MDAARRWGKTMDWLKRETSTLKSSWGLDAKEMAGLAALTRPRVWGWRPQISCSHDSVSAPYESRGGHDTWRTHPPSASRVPGLGASVRHFLFLWDVSQQQELPAPPPARAPSMELQV